MKFTTPLVTKEPSKRTKEPHVMLSSLLQNLLKEVDLLLGTALEAYGNMWDCSL